MSPRDVVKGGYVLYFRHGEADIGEDCRNPKIRRWWRSRSPEKTRQLTEHGKLQSRTIGRAFHKLGIQVDGVWCSEFTRAKDTAEEMNLGRVRTTRALTPLVYEGSLEERMESLLRRNPERGTVSVLVAHGHVLPDFEDLYEGDAAVFSPGPEPQLKGYIRYQSWEDVVSDLHFESTNKKDHFVLEDGLLTVKSSMGIGTVTVTPRGDVWPDIQAIRFEYVGGRGMPVLEGLRLTAGENRNSSLEPKMVNGALQLPFDPDFVGNAKSLEIHWVDFYR